MGNFVFVAGSAHIDVLATATDPRRVTDRIGTVSVEIGGSAANVATNLAQLGLTVRFVTAMNRSPFSSVVLSYLRDNGVQPKVVFDEDLPTAAFSAHIDHTGELASAITSTPVEHVRFDERFLADALEGAAAAVVDCNLSSQTLDLISELCLRRNIPCYCSGVSEPKVLRIADVLHPFAGVFLNRRELSFLMNRKLSHIDRYEDIAAQLSTTMFVTRDEDGVAIVTSDGTCIVKPPALDDGSGNKLGLGDAFMSAVVYQLVSRNADPVAAAESALEYVRLLARRTNCNVGSESALASIISNLDRDAHTDRLTGVYNRRASEQLLAHAVSEASQGEHSLAVLLLDIDHFKSINDTFGHPQGDVVLQRVSGVIQSTVRDGDSAGRWGGEEFVCVLPDASLDVAHKVAERICEAVRRDVVEPRPVTISCGVATLHSNETFSDVVNRADQALYAAKKSGRNRVVREDALPAAVA